MKFAKRFAALGLLTTSAFFLSNTFAQEEFIDDQPAPNTNGMFDDELEPINEPEISKPSSQPMAQPTNSNPSVNFPAPKPAGSSFKGGSPLKSLPPLPGNIDVPKKSEKLRVDFVQVEIEEVVKYFAERLKKRFVYDPSILSGKITIISPTEVSLEEAWGAFLSALEVRGYIIYPAGPYLKLEKAANARKTPTPVYVGKTPNNDQFVTRIVTLKYLSVNDIRQAIRNLLSRTGGDVIEHAPTNTLIISDYAYNIRKIIQILNILDVEGFQEQISVIGLKHASAADVARKVTEFFPTQGGARGVRRTTGGATPVASAGGEAAGVIQKIVADDRTNSVIVLGSDRGIEQVRKFIEQIDVPVEGGGGLIHVYPLQNVKAEDISQTLAALTSGSSSRRSGSNNNPNLPPGIPPIPTSASSTAATLLNGDVKITADNATNSLVIQASSRDFDVIKTIIRKLDIRRRQVFIEGAILEARVRKGSAFGMTYQGPLARPDVLRGTDSNGDKVPSGVVGSIGSAGGTLDALLQNPASLTGLALGFRSGGTFPVNITNPTDGSTKTLQLPLLSAILRLSAESQDLNVLSTPHVLATANEEANISIGTEIPQLSNETRVGETITRNVTRLRVANELTITPQINVGDYLTLKIKQKVNELIPGTAGDQAATINREATTTVIVKDQQTIVIGGLMEDRKTTQISKVPFLGDIPILGWLFKSRTTSAEKVNLLLFLTPHIIRDTADMNDNFFKKLEEREKFLKEIGMEEKKGIPVSGLTDDQLKMLDAEYVKSLKVQKLDPLKQASEGDNPNSQDPSVKIESPKIELPPAEPIRVGPSVRDDSALPLPPTAVESSPEISTPPPPSEILSPVEPLPTPPVPEFQLEDSPPEPVQGVPSPGNEKLP